MANHPNARERTIERMLVLSRARGESILLGDARLVVQRVNPHIQLDYLRSGNLRQLYFDRKEVGSLPVLSLADEVEVSLIRLSPDDKLVFGINAPRNVRIMRGELSPEQTKKYNR
jgi:sRNA-binding carbon storage regulator CsrA